MQIVTDTLSSIAGEVDACIPGHCGREDFHSIGHHISQIDDYLHKWGFWHSPVHITGQRVTIKDEGIPRSRESRMSRRIEKTLEID